MNEIESRTMIASMLTEARKRANVNQKEISRRINRSERTVKNWENGDSMPDCVELFMWFKALNIHPLQYILGYIHTDAGIPSEDKLATARAYMDGMTDKELDAFNFLMSGTHGGSSYAFWQEIVANLQCPIGSRETVAVVVENNYKNAEAMGKLTVPDGVKPDLNAFSAAIIEGREANRRGLNQYVLGKME